MLEIVPQSVAPAWASIPEYTVHTEVITPAALAGAPPVAATEGAGGEVVAQAPEAKSGNTEELKDSAPEGSEAAQTSKE